MKKTIFRVLSLLLILSLVGCAKVKSTAKDPFDSYAGEYKSIYVSDEEKGAWFTPIVKLISNQEELIEDEFGRGLGYEAPRPDEPSITWGYGIGLFDITMDGVPEVIVDGGGGSSGCNLYLAYDIFSGKEIASINGSIEEGTWGIYYNLKSEEYRPICRYSLRGGWDTNSHFITTIEYNEERQEWDETVLFYSRYYYEDIEMLVAHVTFEVGGKATNSQGYEYRVTAFYQENCLLPQTGLKTYDWYEVAEDDDSYQERAEKMARMLLFGSGQQFVKIDNDK